jgi:hypothetical protein
MEGLRRQPVGVFLMDDMVTNEVVNQDFQENDPNTSN